MDEANGKEWKALFQQMMAETDVAKLREKMTLAEDAIFRRSQALVKSPDGEAEREEIEAACKQLLKIQIEKLGFPAGGKLGLGGAESVGKVQE